MEACTSHIFLFLHTRMSLLVRHTFRALNSVFAASELIQASEMKDVLFTRFFCGVDNQKWIPLIPPILSL